jgi:hypothetical protein
MASIEPGPSDRGPQIGRLALRVEGNNWNAYYARETTMQDAAFLGSLCMAFATNPTRKAQFLELMRECVADLIEEATGVRPLWGGPHTAPEHERGGHG